jgi:hypothetical protein
MQRRTTANVVATVVLAGLAVFYMLFAATNLRPTYPKLEAAAAGIGGLSLAAAAILLWRAPTLAATVAALGTSALVAWFAYDAWAETLFYMSMVAPVTALGALAILRTSRRRRHSRMSDVRSHEVSPGPHQAPSDMGGLCSVRQH